MPNVPVVTAPIFSVLMRRKLIKAMACGKNLKDAAIEAGYIKQPKDGTVAELSQREWEELQLLIATQSFKDDVNTIVANEMLASGMALAWKAVKAGLTDSTANHTVRLNAASWVRETLKDMASGSLGVSEDKLRGMNYQQIMDMRKELLEVVMDDSSVH